MSAVNWTSPLQLDAFHVPLVDQAWLQALPVPEDARLLLARAIGIGLILVAMLVAHFISYAACRVLKLRVKPGSLRATFLKYQVISERGGPLAALVALIGLPLVFSTDPTFLHYLMVVAWIYFISVISRTAFRVLRVIGTLQRSSTIPLTSLVQAAQILVAVFSLIAIASIILGESPLLILSGLGAMAAVLMLVFKDPLLGLVAGVQLSAQDMIRLGDWIQLPDNTADGTVISITLTTVKVQNFDKTISYVPPVALISQAFTNWRGMSESGGRRIKRQISLDLPSLRVVDDALRKEASTIEELAPFLASSEGQAADLTNSQLFRAYIKGYLHQHREIYTDNPSFTFLVRHLAPTELGLPIQIYAFTTTTDWETYENIQADIFDHLFGMLPRFGLMAYQEESDFTTQLPSESLVRRPPVSSS